MTIDSIMLKEPLLEDELASIRQRMVEEYGVTEFTCDTCPARYKCTLAFDPYNTDGDCLAEK